MEQKKQAPGGLREELLALRQSIREEEKLKTGRTPIVCSDESIDDMMRLMPQKASDFFSIVGVGPAFVENYADRFLTVLNGEAESCYVNEATATTLRELSKKLINITKNNRMLFMPRLSTKYGVDLYDPDAKYDPLKIVFEVFDSISLAETTDQSSSRSTRAKERYRGLVNLIREYTRDLRDKGQNDLYIGYPFVQGCLAGSDFPVRAPLCLFPVTLERTASSILVEADLTRDIVFNSTLILAHNKFNAVTKPLPDCTLDDVHPASFLQAVVDFYAENGLLIDPTGADELQEFKSYPGETFPKYKRGTLKMVANVVIGKFPAYSNAIQRDFDEILSKGLVNRLVADLVTDYEETDFFADESHTEELNNSVQATSIKEDSLVYINALNSAQEIVLHAVQTQDELVVEGPPGTGKSQTITSLITQFVDSGKTVLMVSEKKTALDVVYSRLGNLSRYAMMLDDVTNKNAFYAQLEPLLSEAEINDTLQTPDLTSISAEIDMNVAILERIAEKLFTKGRFGIEPYQLYHENRRFDLKNKEEIKSYKTLRSVINEPLMALQYQDLSAIRRKFSNAHLTDSLELYQRTVERFPWFLKMKDDLSKYDLILLSEAIDEVIPKTDAWRAQSFFKRLFSRPRLGRDVRRAVGKHFKKKLFYPVRLMLEQPEAVKLSLDEFITGYANIKPLVLALTANEKLYLSALRKLHKAHEGNLIEWNDELYNAMLFEHIQRFESENRSLLPQINSFEKIIDSIEKSILEKQQISKARISAVLSETSKNLTASKRRGEIKRAIESRRRPSISKFVNKFDFELFKAVRIWLMTPEAVSEVLPQQNNLFDLLIFDEASQLYVEKSIPSIVRAKKVVIAGDHKQLRPSSLGDGRFTITPDMLDEDEEISAALEEESLLDLARFRYPDVLLNTHYRSKYEELIDFSNYAFYQGRLFVAPNTDMPEKPPIEVHLVDGATWTKRANRTEAERVVTLIKEFFATRQQNETVGIITFNSSQRDLIYDVIDEESAKDAAFGAQIRAEMARKDNGEDTGLFIKNIESVQGDERDVVIFSIGYAKNTSGRISHNFGWLNQKGGENRLNVAISRARRKIHIVTSFRPSELSVDDTKNQGPVILKKYLEYAFAISEGNKEEAERILHSFGDAVSATPAPVETEFAQRVAESMRERGYDIDTQVGIGGYRIDVAVKKNGKYVLGIECDGKLYSISRSARERDYHRQKYLEARGWCIKRVWSADWWRDPEEVLNRLCKLADRL